MTNTWLARYRGCLSSGTMIFALITGIGAISTPLTASAQNKKDVISFDLVANPQFVKCLRRSQYEEPRARATVIRGKLNDVLFLDLDGFKPGLQFEKGPFNENNHLSKHGRDMAGEAQRCGDSGRHL